MPKKGISRKVTKANGNNNHTKYIEVLKGDLKV
jgi:hypothetical protein